MLLLAAKAVANDKSESVFKVKFVIVLLVDDQVRESSSPPPVPVPVISFPIAS